MGIIRYNICIYIYTYVYIYVCVCARARLVARSIHAGCLHLCGAKGLRREHAELQGLERLGGVAEEGQAVHTRARPPVAPVGLCRHVAVERLLPPHVRRSIA